MISKIYKKLLSVLKKHTFYYRIMIPFSVLSIVLVSVTTLVSWRAISERYEAEIMESNVNILTQVQIYTDQNIYESIMAVINTNFLNITLTSDIEQFFNYGKKLQSSKILGAYQSIRNICNNSLYIEHVTLYHKKDDLLLDADYGLCYDATPREALLNKTIPFSLYNDVSTNSLNKYIYLTSRNGLKHSGYSLVLLRAIPLYADFGYNTGYIAVGVDKEQLLEDIKYKYSLQGVLMILDNEGLPLLEDTESFISYDELVQIIELDENKPYAAFSYNGREYSLIALKSETSGWTYLYCIPLDVLNADSIAVRQFVIVLAVLVILFSMVIIQIISNRVYQPLKNFRKKFDSDDIWLDDEDDIKSIQNTFSFLESRMEDMRDTFSRNKSILLYKSLLDILYGNVLSEDTINKQLQMCGITFQESHFCLVIVEIEKGIFSNLTLEQREYMTVKFQDFINDWYKDSVIQMTEAHPNNRIVALLNLNGMQYARLLDEEQRFLDYLQNNLHIAINIAISECTDCLMSVSSLYPKTCDYLKYSFIYNYGNVFTSEKNALFEQKQLEISLNEYQEMELLVRNDNIEKMMQILDDYIEQICTQNYSYHSVNNFLMQLYGIVIRIGREFHVFENEPEKKDKIVCEFNRAVNLKQSIECIYLLLCMYRDVHHKTGDKSNIDLVKSVVDYIYTNCHEEITLVSVAEHFHISTSHLSRLFKNIKGENFSTFVVNVKLEKAAQMLVEERQMSVNEIAESLGYYAPAYFTRLFKGKYGVTPVSYRKNRHNSLDRANILL